jgi:hypothetical protein
MMYIRSEKEMEKARRRFIPTKTLRHGQVDLIKTL